MYNWKVACLLCLSWLLSIVAFAQKIERQFVPGLQFSGHEEVVISFENLGSKVIARVDASKTTDKLAEKYFIVENQDGTSKRTSNFSNGIAEILITDPNIVSKVKSGEVRLMLSDSLNAGERNVLQRLYPVLPLMLAKRLFADGTTSLAGGQKDLHANFLVLAGAFGAEEEFAQAVRELGLFPEGVEHFVASAILFARVSSAFPQSGTSIDAKQLKFSDSNALLFAAGVSHGLAMGTKAVVGQVLPSSWSDGGKKLITDASAVAAFGAVIFGALQGGSQFKLDSRGHLMLNSMGIKLAYLVADATQSALMFEFGMSKAEAKCANALVLTLAGGGMYRYMALPGNSLKQLLADSWLEAGGLSTAECVAEVAKSQLGESAGVKVGEAATNFLGSMFLYKLFKGRQGPLGGVAAGNWRNGFFIAFAVTSGIELAKMAFDSLIGREDNTVVAQLQ